MKWITRDTVWALMSPTVATRNKRLREIGFTAKDFQSDVTMYAALPDVVERPVESPFQCVADAIVRLEKRLNVRMRTIQLSTGRLKYRRRCRL